MVCYRPAQAHHLTFVEKDGLRGMRRSGDQDAVPLCDDHHRHLHKHGNEQRWWAMEGIDPLAWIENFTRNKEYYHGWKKESDDDEGDDDGSEVNE